MTPEQLISRIRAALDETERKAREAEPQSDADDLELGDRRSVWDDPNGEFHGRDGPVFAHILHHPPAAVLRRVAADREIVERCEQYARWAANDEAPGFQALKSAGEYMLRALARGLGINPEEETPQ